jgi:hypothetical protein
MFEKPSHFMIRTIHLHFAGSNLKKLETFLKRTLKMCAAPDIFSGKPRHTQEKMPCWHASSASRMERDKAEQTKEAVP